MNGPHELRVLPRSSTFHARFTTPVILAGKPSTFTRPLSRKFAGCFQVDVSVPAANF